MRLGNPEDKIQATRIAIGIGDTHRTLGNLCHSLEEHISLEPPTACIVGVQRTEDRRSAMYPDVTQANASVI